MLMASVPVARIMGPEALGHYIYLIFLTGVAQRLGNVGIPATANKYIAEYLGSDQPGVAHEIYWVTLKHQAIVATIVTSLGLLLALSVSDPEQRIVALIIVLSMWPSMINYIPSQANLAAEDIRANVPGSIAYLVIYTTGVVLTLANGWGLVGLASATCCSKTAEAAVRYRGVRLWLGKWPRVPLSFDLRRRMSTFSRQNLVLLALGLVVWDRSELLFLKQFAGVQEVAFYSLAFSVTNQLLMAPRALSTSIGLTIFAQYGRDSTRLGDLVQNATRYVGLVAIPIFLGMAAIADPLIRVVYGERYLAVVPVLQTMSFFAIARAFQLHSENLLQATETQGFIVKWLTLSAVANLSLDWLLIPKYGALGAAAANGLSQTLAVAGVWAKASSILRIRLPLRILQRVFFAGAALVVTVVPLGSLLPAPVALVVGIAVGVSTFGVAVRLTNCLLLEDWHRFIQLSDRIPRRFQWLFDRGLSLLFSPTVLEPAARFESLTQRID